MARDKGPTQAEQLLSLLRQRGAAGVTPLQALEEIGSFRLAARVSDLRAAGHRITTHSFTTPSGATVARYVLEGGEAERATVAKGQVTLPW